MSVSFSCLSNYGFSTVHFNGTSIGYHVLGVFRRSATCPDDKMLFAMLIKCSIIPPYVYGPFKKFTSPLTNTLLSSDSSMFAIGATVNKKPAGLLVAKQDIVDKNQTMTIESLFVDKELRRIGVGSSLLQKAEEIANKNGETLKTELVCDAIGTTDVHLLLDSFGWSPAKETSTVCRSQVAPSIFPMVNNLSLQFRQPFESFAWGTRTCQDELTLQSLITEFNIPIGLQPSSDKRLTIQEDISAGLRHKNQLVGWMIVHKLNNNTLRYSSLWIAPEFIGKGLGLLLVIDSLRRYDKVTKQYPNSIWMYTSANDAMNRFFHRRLKASIHSSKMVSRTKEITGA